MHNANNHVNKTPLHKCLGNNALASWQPAAPDHFTQRERARLVAARCRRSRKIQRRRNHRAHWLFQSSLFPVLQGADLKIYISRFGVCRFVFFVSSRRRFLAAQTLILYCMCGGRTIKCREIWSIPPLCYRNIPACDSCLAQHQKLFFCAKEVEIGSKL